MSTIDGKVRVYGDVQIGDDGPSFPDTSYTVSKDDHVPVTVDVPNSARLYGRFFAPATDIFETPTAGPSAVSNAARVTEGTPIPFPPTTITCDSGDPVTITRFVPLGAGIKYRCSGGDDAAMYIISGTLPTGATTFTDNGDNTAKITGNPSHSPGDFPFTIRAANDGGYVDVEFTIHLVESG